MDYLGDDPNPNPDTLGLIVDDVNCLDNSILPTPTYQSVLWVH
jgi:hypothetical protein